MRHELKSLPKDYCRIADGSKTFEMCDAEVGIQSGDTVVLREWDPTPISSSDKDRKPKGFTGSKDLEFKVGYIYVRTSGEFFFSLLPLPPKKGKRG